MKMKIIILSLAAAMGIFGVAQFTGFPEANVTTHVVDENGQPFPGVNATFGFQGQFDHNAVVNVEGVTDANGNFTGEGYTPGPVGSKLIKEGYYMGWANIPNFTQIDALHHWLPWDQTYTTMLRKIGDPIPMYARNLGTEIPAVGESCGFDLERADWTPPYGKGRTADFFVTLTRRYTSWNDFDVAANITFPNSGDGILETQLPAEFANSLFKWPRLAPETGYQPTFQARYFWQNTQIGNTHMINTADENHAYFFRVRTVMAGDQVKSALYGKILGGIGIDPRNIKICELGFTYYLNPTPNDRNMEYDPNQDLFKNLDYMEIPRAP
jgi:hypothetical protein